MQTLLQSFRQSPAPLFPTCKQDHEITALLLRQKIIPSTECESTLFQLRAVALDLEVLIVIPTAEKLPQCKFAIIPQ